MRKVFIIRYQFVPVPNQRAAEALVEFYNPGEATIHPTPFGMISCLLTKAAPETIFAKLKDANIGDEFSIIEVDPNGIPIKILTSTDPIEIPIDHVGSPEEIQIELDSLLDKIQRLGQNTLTEREKARLTFLSGL